MLIEHPFKGDVSVAQFVASMSGVVLDGVVEVVGSNLARGKIFTASIDTVHSLYPSVYNAIHVVYWFIFNGWHLFSSQMKASIHSLKGKPYINCGRLNKREFVCETMSRA